MNEFKTQQCNRNVCLYSQTTPLNSLKCYFFHNTKDKRRPDTTSYLPYYLYDSVDPQHKFCNNIIEYLFHPAIFKTIACSNKKCTTHNCPFFHDYKDKNDNRMQFPTQSFFPELDSLLQDILPPEPLSLDMSRMTSSISKKSKAPKQIHLNTKTISEIDIGERSFSIVNSPKDAKIYVLDEKVKFFEDHTHEFKNIRKIRLDMVAKYICAFLNYRGGSLFIGITDDGRVRGIQFSREQIDQFQLELDNILRKFDPCVLQEQINLTFSPIYLDQSRRQKHPNHLIIEIKVASVNKYELYFTHKKEAYMKSSASVSMLGPREIKAYIRQRTISQMEDMKQNMKL